MTCMNNEQKIIIVTPTYDRPRRIQYIKRCIYIFKKISNMFWFIVEDADHIDTEVETLLRRSGIDYKYCYFGPTRDLASSQRNYAFSYIRDHEMKGVIYEADDDNGYDLRLFDEIRKTKRVALFPVGGLGPNGIERPIVRDHKIVGWDAYWTLRKYPVDWAGMAFNADVLKEIPDPVIKGFNWIEAVKNNTVDPLMKKEDKVRFLRDNKDGETHFLEKFVKSSDEFELLCEECRLCYVRHDLPLGMPLWLSIFFDTHERIKLFVKQCIGYKAER